MPGWTLAAVRPATGRRVDRARPARGRWSAARARSCPPMTRSTFRPGGLPARRPGHRAAQPRRRAGLSGADSAAVQARAAALPDHRHATASPDAAATTVLVPAERAPSASVRWSPTSAPSTPSRRAASRPTPCAATRWRTGAVAAVRVPARGRRARRGLGGVGARPRGRRRHAGARPTSRATGSSTGCAPRSAPSSWTLSPTRRRSACGAIPAAAWPPHGPPR